MQGKGTANAFHTCREAQQTMETAGSTWAQLPGRRSAESERAVGLGSHAQLPPQYHCMRRACCSHRHLHMPTEFRFYPLEFRLPIFSREQAEAAKFCEPHTCIYNAYTLTQESICQLKADL